MRFGALALALAGGAVLLQRCDRPTPRTTRTDREESKRNTPTAPLPERVPAVGISNTVSRADRSELASRGTALREHAAALRQRLGADFHIRCEWPFVAASNLPLAEFNRVFERSLVGSYRCLRRDYFTSEPIRSITVYLFKNDADYRHYARDLLGDEPKTPFGYWSPAHRALVMNIATGTGTLVHELCHALIERDFPQCPTWFNEGLASLHEQCAWREGSLVGLPNWRLPALQDAIRSATSLSLKDLMAKTDPAKFYGEDEGLNYATARYLCQYIQHQRKLREFYARLKRDIADNPTGQKTLQALLGSPLPEIESAWRRWIMTMHFSE